MKNPHTTANPFLLMMDPEAVMRAVEASERLNKLERHVCRPLDKPMLGGRGADASDADLADGRGEAIDRFAAQTGFQGLA